MSKRFMTVASVMLLLGITVLASVAEAQPGRGGRGGGFPGGFGGFGGFGGRGGGGDLMGLLRMEEVQKEIELLDDQQKEIEDFQEANRGERPQVNFRELSEEERQKVFADFQKRREEQAKKGEEFLAEVLIPPQMDRLKQIQLQVRGVQALTSAEVAQELELSKKQQDDIAAAIQDNQRVMGEKMREMFAGFRGGPGAGGRPGRPQRPGGEGDNNRERGGRDRGDRGGDRGGRDRGQAGGRPQGRGPGGAGGFREEMEKMRKEGDKKVLAVLSEDQVAQFAEMKGAPFKMPEFRGFGGGRGGRGGDGGRGRGGDGGRGGRPQRPQRPGN